MKMSRVAGPLLALFASPLLAAPPSAWTLAPRLARDVPQLPAHQQVAVGVAAEPLLAGSPELLLPLPGGVLEARLDAFETHASGRAGWRGHLAGHPEHAVVLSVADGAVAGVVHTPTAVWELVPARTPGQGWLIELDATRLPPEAPPQVVEPDHPLVLWPQVPVEPFDVGEQTDVLVMYSPQARDQAGGDSQIVAQAQAAVGVANGIFANSQMRARFRIVGVELLADWVEGTSSASAELGAFRIHPLQQARRNARAADLVSLLVANLPDACGIGYLMRTPGAGFAPYAVQITARGCAVGNMSWAHEHGHNLGFEHDPANGGTPGDASWPWSFGHYVEGPDSAFRTVMAYQCPAGGCTRRAYFSNPDVSYGGHPTGIEDARDNARTGDLVADIVANFRQGNTSGVFCSGFEGTEAGFACPPASRPGR